MRGLSCSVHARSPQKTPDCLAGHAIISGNLAKGFVVLTDTAHHVRPFFRWDAMVRLTWTWMLLCGDDRGNTAKQLFECEQSSIDRKSTRLNSSHVEISYAVFCLKKK